jgi:acyl-CoA synthetase (NDP forming)
MDKFFHPASVAVVGASHTKLGGSVVSNLKSGFKGKTYPVNPKYDEFNGLDCFASIEDIPHQVDLAIVIVPAKFVPSVIEACGRKGVKRIIIESAGFAEVGEMGRKLQDQCVAIAKKAGIRLWGPNCMGFVDVPDTHVFSFMMLSKMEQKLLPGRISLIVQSGMLSAIFLAELSYRDIGVAKACSIGNRADVDECDLLEYLVQDPETDVIALYLESIPRGRLFAELAKASPKPIVLLKGGRSEAGARAAMSHTSSLSGNSRLLDSVLEQSGVILANEIYEMMDIANALQMLPPVPATGRVAILTFSGGAGILSCDALAREGLEVARLSETTKKTIGEVFPPWMPVENPIDLFPGTGMYGRAHTFKTAFAAAIKDPAIDILLIHYVAGIDADSIGIPEMKKTADAAGKILFVWLMGLKKGADKFRRLARENDIPVHAEVTTITRALAVAARRQKRQITAKSAGPLSTSAAPGNAAPLNTTIPVWDEYDSKRLLKKWKIPAVAEQLVATEAEALTAAESLGFPVVLKGLVPGETHKTELGLVHLNLSSASILKTAFSDAQTKIAPQGRVLIQHQVKFDYELIAGFLKDGEFGPCVMFGIGGIFAELEPDIGFAMAPLSHNEALTLIDQIRAQKLIDGFRGMAALDREKMADILVNLGDLACNHSEIEQIDINPLAVANGAPLAVDATVVMSQKKG